jgi:hypothetical protein
MPIDVSDPVAVAQAQVAEIGLFESALHGQPREAWGPYRDVQKAAAALPALAQQRAAEVAAVAADDSKPGEYRRTETARLRAAAEQELRDVHGQATVSAARLEAHLRATLVPAVDADPAARGLHRQDLAAAFAGVEPGQRLQVAERIMATAPPGQVAELLSPYGRGLVGASNAELLDKTAVGMLRRRGGHDDASRAAAHALTQYERLRIPGRIDASYTAAALVLQAPPSK